jgi:hypothetical protein
MLGKTRKARIDLVDEPSVEVIKSSQNSFFPFATAAISCRRCTGFSFRIEFFNLLSCSFRGSRVVVLLPLLLLRWHSMSAGAEPNPAPTRESALVDLRWLKWDFASERIHIGARLCLRGICDHLSEQAGLRPLAENH